MEVFYDTFDVLMPQEIEDSHSSTRKKKQTERLEVVPEWEKY